MKKNRMMRLASVLLVCVLLTTSVISGTFAKYTTSATATDAARVAKWDIQINDSQMQAAHTFAFDLFSTVKDSDGTDESDIKTANGSIIAPGTKGSMQFTLKNDSEVTAEYTIDYTITNTAGIPVVFSLDGTNWKNSIDDLDVTTPVRLEMGAEATTVTVHWMWAFNGGDDAGDTVLGLKGTDVITVTAEVVATQVD